MTWLTLALLAMFAKTGQNFTEKHNQGIHGSLLTSFLVIAFATLVITPYVFLTKQIPEVTFGFWIGVVGSASLYVLVKPLRVFAIGQGDISEIVPLVSFSSLFSLFYAWMLLGEVPSAWGIVGVMLVASGGYLMNIERANFTVRTLLNPIKKVFSHKAQAYLFISLVLGALLGVFDKYAINNTFPRSPQFVYMTENFLILPVFAVAVAVRRKQAFFLKNIKNWKAIFLMGTFASVSEALTFSAMSVGNIGYVSAIKNLSAILVVLGGVYYLKESKLKQKLISTIVMASGAFLIAYLG